MALPKQLPKHVKHWLVPHKHNDHRPHLIRAHGLAIITLLILGVQFTAYAAQPAAVRALTHGNVLAYATNITPADLLTQTNQQRAANGLPPLKMDARLNQSAGLKAANMFAEDYWNHVSPSCIQPWYWFTQAGYNYTYAGENLAKDFDTTSGVMDGWMNSPGHRANILNPNYTDVGFAVVNGSLPTGGTETPPCTAATAQTNGQTTLVVAHYGAQAGVAVTATVAAPTPTPKAAAAPAPVVATTTTTPAASPTPTIAPAAPVTASAPAAQTYSFFKPLSLARTLNWSTLVTIVLLGLLLLVYLFTHLTVWRKGLKRWRTGHYRLAAAAQLSGLAVAVLVLATSGFGKVG